MPEPITDPKSAGGDLPTDDKPKPKPRPTKATASGERKTPVEWAEAKGLLTRRDPRLPQQVDVFDPRHAAAAQLHGWTADAHHYQGDQALRLSEEDYDAAIDAAGKFPCCAPHKPALSRTVGDRYQNFKPRAARAPAGTDAR